MAEQRVTEQRRIICNFCSLDLGIKFIYKGIQIRCPHCLNFIPTYKRELTENKFVGLKHIHTNKT